jgi:hypothetical protein
LACGVFEMKPGETPSASTDGTVAGPSVDADDESDDEDATCSLRLPSHQTAAVAAAQRAGRTLVSEVGDDVPSGAEASGAVASGGAGGNAADVEMAADDKRPRAKRKHRKAGKGAS